MTKTRQASKDLHGNHEGNQIVEKRSTHKLWGLLTDRGLHHEGNQTDWWRST